VHVPATMGDGNEQLQRSDVAPVPLICFSHLRWNFVFQRPQHLMSRLARTRQVLFFEEPVFAPAATRLECRQVLPNLSVLTPHLDQRVERRPDDVAAALQHLLEQHVCAQVRGLPILWYYTPMALAFSAGLPARMVVYDCMDELSGFVGAPPELVGRERELLQRAHLVLTGGRGLFEAKRHLNPNTHLFPSSVDVSHFAQALLDTPDPDDQAPIPHPRAGFAGVIDERMDLALLAEAARLRPRMHFVLLGPVVKIDPARLPRAHNIHYLGMKNYGDLPRYMHGWDVAILPFAHNEATRFISPTKTPEYLAAGLPVVSTSIRDVVRPYAHVGLVRVADDARDFVKALWAAITTDLARHRAAAAAFLSSMSWDHTVHRIEALLEQQGGDNRMKRRSQRIGRAVMS
jgi:UDP-galactopyranose mutase